MISTPHFCAVNADVVLKGTNYNGIYDCQSGNGNIVLDHISFREAATRGITSIDTMAVTYCEDNGIPGWLLVLGYSCLQLQ